MGKTKRFRITLATVSSRISTDEEVSTRFWPRIGQQLPANVAAFGENSFASRDTAWARLRYQADDGHHKDAWESVKAKGGQGGFGYDPGARIS